MEEENDSTLKAPFPWFGGKSKAASLIWSRIGSDIGNYVEPFFGSGAVWLGRPAEFSGWATANDLDGLVVNFWRSVQLSPDETAEAACHPVFEADLHARHLALVNVKDQLQGRLMADHCYHDPVLAGWWAWGACVWIRGGWCRGDGPWRNVGGIFQKAGAGDGGVRRKLPHLGNGTGVNRQLPHLGNGTGVNEARLEWIKSWFADLQDSLQPLRLACGDWSRIMSVGTMTRNGVAGVVLDPPYSQTDAVYNRDSSTVAHAVREWAKANGNNKALRIALCGHEGEHNELEAMGWTVETWDKSGGYQGADDRERIWFSPHCIAEKKGVEQIAMF
jgi:hypothetical protein